MARVLAGKEALAVVIDLEIWTEIKRLAEEHKRSIRQEAMIALKRYIEAETKGKK